MAKMYSRYGEIITRANRGEPKDRLAARERARYVERRNRADRQSNDPFIRHSKQIFIGQAASWERQRRRARMRTRLILLGMAALLLLLYLAILAR